jgi:hypothetical protein
LEDIEKKEKDSLILTVEELKNSLNKALLQVDFFYKISTEQAYNDSVDGFFLHCQEK